MAQYENMEEYLKDQIDNGYTNEKGKPLKCTHCDSNDLKHGREYYGPVGIEEYEMICSVCGKQVGVWSYGYWQV